MMEFVGKFENFSKDFFTGEGKIAFSCNKKMQVEVLEGLRNKKLKVVVKEYKEKRGLSANSYYWVLVGQIADVLGMSNSHCHNMMLRRYGAYEVWDGQILYVFLADTGDMEKQVNEAETIHLKPTSQTIQGKKGETLRMYITMKGSHDYDTKEMSRLIDGVVDEAKQLGIQTMSPKEVERLVKEWGEKALSKKKKGA